MKNGMNEDRKNDAPNDQPNEGRSALQATPLARREPRFPLGRICTTPGAEAAIQGSGIALLNLLHRHITGDWGELSDDDWKANDDALAQGTRLFSVYPLNDGQILWIITEADRSVTTALLPEEY